MLYTIEEIKEKAIPIAKKYGIESLSLFGSYARGEANEKSDIDFLIDKGRFRNLFEHAGMRLDLQDIFNCNVDLVVLSGVKNKDFYNEIKREGLKIYGKQ